MKTNPGKKPILFQSEMVRAILEKRKRQARWIITDRRKECQEAVEKADAVHWVDGMIEGQPLGISGWFFQEGARLFTGTKLACPYGQPGDRLWVREAWRTIQGADDIPPRNLMNVEQFTTYEADEPKPSGMGKLRPSMFMPRWASRLTLEIVSVRVERLQDISDADALDEGVTQWAKGALSPAGQNELSAIGQYGMLWESINGPDSWAANAWVWVVEFTPTPSADQTAA